ncbi:MAG TPA: hypothetical protein VK711_00305 [Puia sp.]|nr:hypothetical protein [Puia sp.]
MRLGFIILFMGCFVSVYAQDNEAQLNDSFVFQNLNTKIFLRDTSILKKGIILRISRTVHTSVPAPAHSHLEINMSYQSNDVYNGRKNETIIPVVTPRISYIFKNGIQFDASVGYDLNDPSPQTNQYTLDGTYNFSPGNGNYSSSVTVSTFVYNKQSGSISAEQKGSIEIDNSYDFNIVQPSVYLTWSFGGGKDYAATFSLQHEFDILKNKMNITPTFNMNAGTQNFLDSYYKNRKYKIHYKDDSTLYENVTVYGNVLNAGKFIILNYEMALPVNFSTGRWTFNFTPNYSIPVNPAKTVITISYQDQVIKTKNKKEEISNTFYFQTGVTYDF